MMYASCKCLNISIKSKRNEIQEKSIDDLELTETEKANPFFQNNIGLVSELEGITKEQPGLVEVSNIGSWAIHRCYNCLLYTHAIHRELGAGLVLINTDIITTEEEIMKLKNHDDFSSVFRIIIDHSKIDEFDPFEMPSKCSVSQLSSSLRLALGSLEHQLDEAIQQQVKLIDERIRAYTKEQYQILEDFRERAHVEHAALAKLLYDEDNIINSNKIRASPASIIKPDISNLPLKNDFNESLPIKTSNKIILQDASNKAKNLYIMNGKNSNAYVEKKQPNYDDEALFMFEGIDENTTSILPQDNQESDTDDSGNEGVQIPRSRRSGHTNLARSLPVTVPAFQSFGERHVDDDDDFEVSCDPMDPNNIRNSIKALAKSVHGDTVFGDLPRPRFSTQI